MAREFAKQFYNSKEWKQCKEAYIVSVNGLCERCLKQGKYVPGYIVHHKKYLKPSNINNPDITLNWDNLEYVCQYHHNLEHHGIQIDKRYTFDSNGQPILIEEFDG